MSFICGISKLKHLITPYNENTGIAVVKAETVVNGTNVHSSIVNISKGDI